MRLDDADAVRARDDVAGARAFTITVTAAFLLVLVVAFVVFAVVVL